MEMFDAKSIFYGGFSPNMNIKLTEIVWQVSPTDVLEMTCFQCGMFWSDLVQFSSGSPELPRRSKGSLWVPTLHLNCRFPVGHHVVQSALIQEQRSWFWTLFEVLVRVWPIQIWMFGTGGANLEPRFKTPPKTCLFLILVKTETTNLPLPTFTQIQKYNKVSFSSLL